jgi:hypothetical protein
MPRSLRMPTDKELPNGATRWFVEELFRLYRRAGRPPLRAIAEKVEEMADETDLNASRETIRRMLTGRTVPPQWRPSVEAVLTALCALAGVTPEDEPPEMDRDDYELGSTYRTRLTNAWNNALDNPQPRRSEPRVPVDLWSTGSSTGWGSEPQVVPAKPVEPTGYSDEPPF